MSPAERATEQRARIIEAAVAVYSEKGYYETLVEDIAAKANVSRRTIYVHFKDLDDLRFAVFERSLEATLVELGRIATATVSGDRLVRVLTEAFRQVQENRKFARVVTYELRRPEHRNIELRERILTFFAGVWVEAVAEDVRAGRVTVPIDEPTAYAWVGGIEALLFRCVDDPTAIDVDATVASLVEAFRIAHPYSPDGRPETGAGGSP
ncbi:MAG: TetR/AcrR family transcriptional regulator [Polyangiaceae bacterium]